MSARKQDKPFDFKDAARLIAEKESDVGWLTYALRFWIWPQEKWPARSREMFGPGLGMFADFARMRRGRREAVKALTKTLPKAAQTIIELTRDWPLMQILMDDAFGPGFGHNDHNRLTQLLWELCRRSLEAARSPELVTKNGKARAGRNRVLAPGQVDEKVACAATVMVAWKFVRGDPPGPSMKNAAAAAEILFVLGSAPAGRYDQVKSRTLCSDPRDVWRPHFKAAALPNPALEKMNAMFAGELEFMRRWYAGDPAARAFRTMFAVNPPEKEPI